MLTMAIPSSRTPGGNNNHLSGGGVVASTPFSNETQNPMESGLKKKTKSKHASSNYYDSMFNTTNNINVNFNFQDMNMRSQGATSNPDILKLRE